MTRKQALAELIAKVEAGSNPSQAEWAEVFPDTPNDDDYPLSMMATQANVGWLDAAKALHEAVLPGFTFWQITRVNDNFSMVSVCDIPRSKGAWLEPSYRGESPDQARAWLLAILCALHAMEAE